MPQVALFRLTLPETPAELRAFYVDDPNIVTVLGTAMLQRLAVLTPGVTASYTVELFELENPPT